MGVSLWASAYPGRAEDCVDDVDHEEDAAKWRGESSGWDVDADAGGGWAYQKYVVPVKQ